MKKISMASKQPKAQVFWAACLLFSKQNLPKNVRIIGLRLLFSTILFDVIGTLRVFYVIAKNVKKQLGLECCKAEISGLGTY